jgi:hypothetical protein
MAKYSFSQYGSPKYGEIENNRVFYNVGLTAWSYDYQTISLTWGSVITDPADPLPTHWKLVKSFSGAPLSPYDGISVDEDVISSYRLAKIDVQTLEQNSEITYSFWVFNGANWISCGNTKALAVLNTDTINKVSKWIPRVWLNNISGELGDLVGETEPSNELYKILTAYSFAYDRLRAEAQILEKSSDFKKVSTALLRNKIQDLGFSYEPTLGDTYHRSLYRSGNIINATKGTSRGISAYTTSLTHWDTDVRVGHNLMLDYNDSSFEESLGRWGIGAIGQPGGTSLVTINASTISHQKYATSLADLGVTVTPPSPGLYDPVFSPRDKGFMAFKGPATGGFNITRWFRLPAEDGSYSTKRDVQKGIPVTPGKRYIFTGWVRSKNARPVSSTYPPNVVNYTVCYASIRFFDKDNALLGQSSFGNPVYFTNTWQEFNTGRNDNGVEYQDRVGHLAPANSVYAAVQFFAETDHVLGDLYFDMFQFCEAEYSLEYQDARKVIVTVSGEKENILPNPGFDNSTSSWSSLNATLSQDFNPPTTAKIFGVAVAKIKATSDDTVAFVSDWVPVAPGSNYTFSIHASGAARAVKARIEYSSQQSDYDQVTVLNDTEGKYYPIDPYYVDSASVTLTSTAQRLSVTSVAPVQTTDSGIPLAKVSVYTDAAEINDVFYFDAALLEQSPVLDSFFQGSGAPTPANPNTSTFYVPADCHWEIKNVVNFVSNSSLEDTTGWAAGSGTTFTSVSEISPALYGAKQGKVSKAGGGSISTVVTLPNPAIGGEDMIVSAYIRNKAGTYSISTNGQAVNLFEIEEANKDSWTRIYVPRVAAAGETTFTLTISLSTGSGSAAVFYIDGVQAEFGRIPSKFADPAGAGVITRPNTGDVTKNMYLSREESSHGGKSNYWANYYEKYSRLFYTLPKVLPHGSSWSIEAGKSTIPYPELETSLIPSASFERSLGSWSGIAANLSRTVTRGTLFDEYCTHGTAFCKVTANAASAFGITTGQVPVLGLRGYYASVAVKPENEDAFGTYTLSIKFYDDFDIQIINRTATALVTRQDRWAYIAATISAADTAGASYAVLSVTCASTSPAATGQTFHIDRVVFRE